MEPSGQAECRVTFPLHPDYKTRVDRVERIVEECIKGKEPASIGSCLHGRVYDFENPPDPYEGVDVYWVRSQDAILAAALHGIAPDRFIDNNGMMDESLRSQWRTLREKVLKAKGHAGKNPLSCSDIERLRDEFRRGYSSHINEIKGASREPIDKKNVLALLIQSLRGDAVFEFVGDHFDTFLLVFIASRQSVVFVADETLNNTSQE